eukprot:3324127-Pleurochrysis_carterae.AAC.1
MNAKDFVQCERHATGQSGEIAAQGEEACRNWLGMSFWLATGRRVPSAFAPHAGGSAPCEARLGCGLQPARGVRLHPDGLGLALVVDALHACVARGQ